MMLPFNLLPMLVAVIVAGALGIAARPLHEALGAGAVVGLLVAVLSRRGTTPPATLAASVADLNPDALVLYSDTGRIRYANGAARDLFFEGTDPAGQNFLRLAGRAPAALSQALLDGSDRLFTFEVEQQTETFHLSRCAYDLDGQEVTLLVVRNLTREISRREVSTLKNVVRVISHEVNNSLAPIASLVNSARLIAERPEHAAKLASVFDTIEERTKHLHAFLEGYSGLARLPVPQPRNVEWGSFLQHLKELYPEISLPEPSAAPGYFDATQLEQVLINLIKNAVEAGSPKADVELRVREELDGSTRIQLADRGPGFTEESLKSAFMPFYTTKTKGSGMGHALSREIVHAHGGTISLANREGGGAQVTIILPGTKPPDGRLARSRTKLTLSRA
ncbi:MAG: ATP-binding protein [Myxococcales bacterium]|nr:ATP-binding protein [Myxococcales bacterium]